MLLESGAGFKMTLPGAYTIQNSVANELIGYFETAPNESDARNVMCVRKNTNGSFRIGIATIYCPSKACYNGRPEFIDFEVEAWSNRVGYTEKESDCRIDVHFLKNGAVLTQNPSCLTDEHPYLYAAGKYTWISTEIPEGGCGPE
jgi:hypothetical protein